MLGRRQLPDDLCKPRARRAFRPQGFQRVQLVDAMPTRFCQPFESFSPVETVCGGNGSITVAVPATVIAGDGRRKTNWSPGNASTGSARCKRREASPAQWFERYRQLRCCRYPAGIPSLSQVRETGLSHSRATSIVCVVSSAFSEVKVKPRLISACSMPDRLTAVRSPATAIFHSLRHGAARPRMRACAIGRMNAHGIRPLATCRSITFLSLRCRSLLSAKLDQWGGAADPKALRRVVARVRTRANSLLQFAPDRRR